MAPSTSSSWEEHKDATLSVKRICVVGAGASGLVVMKELKEVGIDAICFDTLPCVGGVYAKSYDNTMLTTSSLLTSYSSFSDGKEKDPKFWTDEEYLKYLSDFADHFDLKKNIRFRTAVEKVVKCSQTGKYFVTVRGGAAVAPHRTYGMEGIPQDENAEYETFEFDGLAICTGTNNWACRPTFPGEEKFKGSIVHSDDYRSVSDYEGKKVAIIGAGESGSDICNEISKVAAKTCIVIRGKHGHLIPRIQDNGRVTDLNTNRCRYSNPYEFGVMIGYVNQQAKRFQAMITRKKDDECAKVLKKIAQLNIEQGTSAFSKFGCKNAGFVEAMVQREAELHRDGFALDDGKLVFDDGSEFECDAIIACTGYRNNFPFLEQNFPELACMCKNPRTMYKQIFPPCKGTEVAFFGFARPAFGSIPPTSEMQARYYAMTLAGELDLPSEEEMIKIAKEDQLKWEKRFWYDAPRVKGLVDFQLYADDLAKIMGCMPNVNRYLRTDPKLWSHIMFGPLTMHQYRLVGPHATPEFAKDVIMRMPTGDALESVITASFLLTSKVLGMVGFKKYAPNNL